MADYTAVRIGDVEGPYHGAFKRLRAALGVNAFGLQVVDLPANATAYPEHDHSGDGQEEVYVALAGSGAIEIDGERVPFDGETVVRVGPTARRKLLPGEDGLRVLVVGAAPGKAYEPPAWSEAGASPPGA